jgi:hypothetical protein
MKKSILSALMILMMFLAACTPKIYGVPEDRWESMSEGERVAAMEAYKARQEALRQQRQEQARLRAMEKKAQLAREAEEARRLQMRVDAIYHGKGLYGELLRVNLQGGMLQFHGVHKPYHPVSFRIAAGETKDVEIVSAHGRKARMVVLYDGSNLLLDEKPKSVRSTAIRLPYEHSWETGATYPRMAAKGPLELRGVDVTVRIIGAPPRHRNDHRHRRPGAVQPTVRMPRKPAVVVVREPDRHPDSQVVVIDRRPATRKPDVIVVKPRPAEKRPGKVVPGRPHKVAVVKKPNHHPDSQGGVVDRRPETKKPGVIVVKPQPVENRPGKVVPRRPHQGDAAPAPPARIKVVFRNGRVTVKKSSSPLVPQTIQLRDGQVRDVVMRGRKGNLKIRVGYSAGELLIDDIPNHHSSPTRLGFVPGWKDGQRYAVETCGNGLLKDLDLMVVSQ